MVKKVIQGNHEAFATLYEKYQPIVFRFIQKFLKSPELSGDVCQEVFIKLWDARHQLGEVNSFRAFLFTMARNHTLNTLKRVAIEQNLKSRVLFHYARGRNEVDDEVQSEEYRAYILTVLQTLPAKSREMFNLCRVEGKTYDEAAIVLGVSRHTIKKHMVSSMKALKYAVEKEWGIFFTLLISNTL